MVSKLLEQSQKVDDNKFVHYLCCISVILTFTAANLFHSDSLAIFHDMNRPRHDVLSCFHTGVTNLIKNLNDDKYKIKFVLPVTDICPCVRRFLIKRRCVDQAILDRYDITNTME